MPFSPSTPHVSPVPPQPKTCCVIEPIQGTWVNNFPNMDVKSANENVAPLPIQRTLAVGGAWTVCTVKMTSRKT